MNITKTQVSRIINTLKKDGYIEVELIHKENSKEIAMRLLTFLYVLVGIFVFLGSLAIGLTFPYQPEEDPNTNLSAPILDENNNTVDEPEITTTTITEKDAPEENIWKAFLSWKNFQLGIFCFCGPCKN